MTLTIICTLLGIIAAVGFGSSYFLGPDNPIEEACEGAIELGTGKQIDLTPSSPEGQPGATGSAVPKSAIEKGLDFAEDAIKDARAIELIVKQQAQVEQSIQQSIQVNGEEKK